MFSTLNWIGGNTEIVLNIGMSTFKKVSDNVFKEPLNFDTEIKLVLAIIKRSAARRKWRTALHYLIRIPNTFAYHIRKNTRKHIISAFTTLQNRFRRRCCSCNYQCKKPGKSRD